jgi:hypothetical protein
MTIPRHKTVKKSKTVTRTISHEFEFKRADLVRLLRLPEDAILTLVTFSDTIVIDGVDAVVKATATETK